MELSTKVDKIYYIYRFTKPNTYECFVGEIYAKKNSSKNDIICALKDEEKKHAHIEILGILNTKSILDKNILEQVN